MFSQNIHEQLHEKWKVKIFTTLSIDSQRATDGCQDPWVSLFLFQPFYKFALTSFNGVRCIKVKDIGD